MTQVITSKVTLEPKNQPKEISALLFRWAGMVLVATVWISAALFGLYILAFYAAALYKGNMQSWNNILPGLYQKGAVASTTGIGLHFAMGGIILVLGSVQLIERVRDRYPAVHRWIGRVYVVASLLAAVGGLIFIIMRGTIGGTVMNIGFALYGVLMFIAAVETYRHAAAGKIETHRAWALRLYALAIGSWLYRMDYGFWFLLANGWGHNNQFTGGFDRVMDFFFYLPNLLIAQAFIRTRKFKAAPLFNWIAIVIVVLMTGFLLIGTYYFTKFYWGPAIVGWFAG